MRKYIFIASLFLLAGCPGRGDRMVPRETTTAMVKGDDVCIISPLKLVEKITAIQINSDNRAYLHKVFDNQPVYVAKGECLPLFGFAFTPGENYSIAYDVQSTHTEHHLLMVELAVEVDSNGRLNIR